MTTVAWDGKTLAGDRQRTCGNTPVKAAAKVRKIGKGKKAVLVGTSGNSADCQAFICYVKRGFKDAPAINSLSAMVISRDGTVTVYNEINNNPCDMGALDMWALGSGGDYALGAMAFGATAAEAVLVATDLDVNTGLGVDTVSF